MHVLGDLDITDIAPATDDIVNQLLLVGSLVYPCLVFVCLSEKGVGDVQIIFCP